ncbi:MAG: phosphonoacetaldehyde reductase [Nocardioidaceae bacterium]|nr:phosphonoacetaldehyde reductase [Nocardioidaceae bacterium]
MSPLPGEDTRPGLFGPNAVAELPAMAESLGLKRMLLLTGRASFAASGAARVLPRLREVGDVETWSDFAPNPRVEDVVAGAQVVRSFEPDSILAIGGGSVLDMAKLLCVLGDLDEADIPDAIRANAIGPRTRTLILAPTTSGSGSEATHFAVAYIGSEKYSVAGQELLPDAVVLDPTLTASASPYQKATSVIDAIAQAVESAWARGATEQSRSFAHQALADLMPSALGYVRSGTPEATLAARGSYLAGRAIDLSKTTGAHAMAYALTSRHGVSHGHAVATTLGAFARLHARDAQTLPHQARLRHDLDEIAGLIGVHAADQIGDRLDAFAAELGLELRLETLGVAHTELPLLVGAVNLERLANNPTAVTEAELIELLEGCYRSSSV